VGCEADEFGLGSGSIVPGEGLTAVVGAGPGGLTAAYVLAARGAPAVVFEAGDTVGGIARTVMWDGYRFDLGGHRFYTKVGAIQRLWEHVLGDEFVVRPRLSRIYFHGSYFAYPLQARDVIRGLGLVESLRCAMSYFRSRLGGSRLEITFEDWVVARFGRRLYNTFFGPYTEKVWGIPGSELRAEWAAQRIKDFSFVHALKSLLGIQRDDVTTLIEEFHYPRLGPGQMWEMFAAKVECAGIPVRLQTRVVSIRHFGNRVTSVVSHCDGSVEETPVEAVLSSMALSDLVLSLDPPAPVEIRAAAESLTYRDFCLVALVIDTEQPFPDNWIYLHDPGVRAGRVQNFGAWSPAMVRPGTTCLGAEYFCNEGDEIWTMEEAELIEMTVTEMHRIGLVDPATVVDGVRVRVPRAYPIYDESYAEALALIHGYLASFENLATFGRNGMHRYNNQDHSMWTAILAALNLLDGTSHDVWAVNTEQEYLEEGRLVDELLELFDLPV
jgi:protoporphyrinogen oxidase